MELITPERRDVLESYPGSYMAAVRAGNIPEMTRVVGIRVEDEETIRAIIQTPISGPFMSCFEHSPRAALVGVKVRTYDTFQFKGDVIECGPATSDDDATVEDFVREFCALVAQVGLVPERYGPAFSQGPYSFVRLRVDEVFDQTPRVGAGNRVASREGV